MSWLIYFTDTHRRMNAMGHEQIKQRIYWFEKNYLFEKMCFFNFFKISTGMHFTIAEHGMRFIPLQIWYNIILCCHRNRRGQSLMVSWLWRRVIYGIKLRVLVAMVTELCTHYILQWYETHTMLCNGMKCIPVLFWKVKDTHFLKQIFFFQINKFFVISDAHCTRLIAVVHILMNVR